MRDVVNRLHANVCYLIMDDLREEELYTQACQGFIPGRRGSS